MDSSRKDEYRSLEVELGTREYRELLERIGKRKPALRCFESWGAFVSFMRDASAGDDAKEAALRAILFAHREDPDPRWMTVLLAVFWPGLISIFGRKQRWDADGDELWQNIVCAFLTTVVKTDVARRADHLTQRIINGTIHRFHEAYDRILRCTRGEVAVEPEKLELIEDVGAGVDFPGIDYRLRQEALVNRLRKHLSAGRISKADFHLIMSTRVDGKSAAEYAREAGMSKDTARKRRLRAEAAIRKAEAFA